MERNRSNPPEAAPDGRRERWRAHREARRRELVRAVVDVVRDRGATVGMDDIAAGTGIAKQVFYRYFADKADLHRAVSRAMARAVVAEVTRRLEQETEPRAMIRAGIECYLRLIEAEPNLYRYVVTVPLATGDTVVEDYSTILGEHVTRLIGDLLRTNGLDAGAAEAWGFALVGAVRAAADRWLAVRTTSRDALTDYLTAYLWSGLAGGSALQGRPSDRPGRLRAVVDS